MSDYEYEISLGPIDYSEFESRIFKLNTDVFAIAAKYKDELRQNKISFKQSIAYDFYRCIVKIKPVSDELPRGLREDLIQYYKSNSLQQEGV